MNCEHARNLLDAYLDRELDSSTQAQMAEHLGGCGQCAALHTGREALREGLRRLPRHEVPPRLRQAIAAALPAAEPRAAPRRAGLWPAALAACTSAALAFSLGLWVAAPQTASDLREPAIARHVASLRDDLALTHVLSSDRHTVKPWFAGKIDFAPPVFDFAEQGFALVGGRLDALDGQRAAAIVYRLREHRINLFVWRAANLQAAPVALSSLRGFGVAAWAADGLNFAAVSDVDGAELRRFALLVQAQTH